ncbi:hypothetical protein D3C79_906890 [compost metagenome]
MALTPELSCIVAAMVVAPPAIPVARPSPLMVAMALLPLLQATLALASTTLPSDRVAMAVNCLVSPIRNELSAGVTTRETVVAGSFAQVTFSALLSL